MPRNHQPSTAGWWEEYPHPTWSPVTGRLRRSGPTRALRVPCGFRLPLPTVQTGPRICPLLTLLFRFTSLPLYHVLCDAPQHSINSNPSLLLGNPNQEPQHHFFGATGSWVLLTNPPRYCQLCGFGGGVARKWGRGHKPPRKLFPLLPGNRARKHFPACVKLQVARGP